MSDPQRDLIIEADAQVTTKTGDGEVTTKTADGRVTTKTADGDLGPYGEGPVDMAWWRDAAGRPIRDANGNSIRVRIP